ESSGDERRDPAINLDARGHGNHDARGCEKALAERRDASREHMVDPQTKREKRRRDECEHDGRIAEYRSARESGKDRRDEAERRNEDEIDLRVSEEPKQMLPK